ncbi:hypothetical protein GNI_003870 [Gregarina niphandrodes]|uniref:Uncharacterized protein n=1 Tax=Gregarina niphandrodes TaxID=110365 RepID=A0A023BDI5_GRENI|nr:hypothetical protein GNI_003870 [Gregarina niphandrodes]EZG88836.1 hypothetical protein GNI_003870 [Gregarina niphandrodes]|eukprot:XP_011128535.1 hypothetical protein GNI_003870 [Gregarina niphandrodes]
MPLQFAELPSSPRQQGRAKLSLGRCPPRLLLLRGLKKACRRVVKISDGNEEVLELLEILNVSVDQFEKLWLDTIEKHGYEIERLKKKLQDVQTELEEMLPMGGKNDGVDRLDRETKFAAAYALKRNSIDQDAASVEELINDSGGQLRYIHGQLANLEQRNQQLEGRNQQLEETSLQLEQRNLQLQERSEELEEQILQLEERNQLLEELLHSNMEQDAAATEEHGNQHHVRARVHTLYNLRSIVRY